MVDRPSAGNFSAVPRTIWKGALSFGLVNIPTGLYPATSDKAVHFNQFEEGTSDRIRYKRVNERTGEEVSGDDEAIDVAERADVREDRLERPEVSVDVGDDGETHGAGA